MKLIEVKRNVMSGQAKRCLARIQIGYTAFTILPKMFDGYVGMQIGLFTPRKTELGYSRTGAWFSIGLHKDKSIYQLPSWYRALCKIFNFRFQ